jgi:putative membrane protein
MPRPVFLIDPIRLYGLFTTLYQRIGNPCIIKALLFTIKFYYSVPFNRHMNSPQEYLANERTFLAWLRTCIAIIGLGFVVAKFGLFLREFGITLKSSTLTDVSTHYASSSLGVALVFIGMGFGIYALKNYLRANQAIKNGTYIPKDSIIYSAVVGLVIFGVLIVAYLIFLPV